MESNVTKVKVTEEFMEDNKEILQEFTDLKVGDEIEIEKNNELVLHPVILLLKDNFEFDTPKMDVYFFGAMYRMYMSVIQLSQGSQNQELETLLPVFKHFIDSILNKCVEDGHIEPVTESGLEEKFNEYSNKILEEIQKFKKEEETK
jgi:hypothetical protein